MYRRAKYFPHVVLEATSSCLCNCQHCMHQGTTYGEDLSLNEILTLFSQLVRLGTFRIDIAGGEPLLRSDIVEIVKKAVEMRFRVSFFTSGNAFSQEQIRKLSTIPNVDFHVSIHGIGEIHDRITQRQGSFQEAVEATRILIESGAEVTIDSVVLQQNVRHLSALADLVSEMGVAWRKSPLIMKSASQEYDIEGLRLSDKELFRYYTQYPEEQGLLGSKLQSLPCIELSEKVMCNAGIHTFLIRSDGEICPCSWFRLPMGNVKESSIRTILDHSPVSSRVRSLDGMVYEECRACEFMSGCKRCPGYAFAEEGSEQSIPREYCRQAKAIKSAITSRNS